VLQIVTRLVVGGAPRHVVQLAAGLDPGRYQVEILAGREEAGETPIWDEAKRLGLKTVRLEALRRPLSPLDDWAAYRQIYRHISDGGFDIVHTHISKAGILGRLAARRAGVPVVVHTYHGVAEEVRGSSWRSQALRWAESRAAKASDALLAVSHEAALELQHAGVGLAGQYRIIGNGIDIERFRPLTVPALTTDQLAGVPEGVPVVGTAARLGPEKGIEVLLQAVPFLSRDFPQLRVCIFGDGSERERLEKEAADLGLGERVFFGGNITDVRPWLARFDAVVLPSRTEGLSSLVLEALAMERPVVASRVGGIPTVVLDGETGVLVPPGDPQALAAGLAKVLTDPDRARAWGVAGRRLVEAEFSLDHMVHRVEAVYQEWEERS
jgi:glycosyltransferase involved in cell wall biosynthesis